MLKGRFCLLILSAVLLSATAAPGKPHKWRVSDPALAESLVARGGKLVADYGSFRLIESDDATLAGAEHNRAELKDEFNFIRLSARPLDTRAPEVQALRKPVGAFAGKRLHLIQFAGPIKPEWRTALEAAGAQVVSYVPHNAYLVFGDAPAVARLQTWAQSADFVQWEGGYADDYKIHPRARLVGASPESSGQTPATDAFAIQLVDDADANAATLALIDRLKLAPVRNQFHLLGYLNVIVRLPPERLNEVAAQPEVVSIQPYSERRKLDERQDQILAGNLTGNSPGGPGYLAWLASKGFSQAQFAASGFAVDVSDSGIDNGTTAPGHFGLYQFGDTNQPRRVIYNRLVGKPNRPGSTLQGCDGHGTLNAHVVAAYTDWTSGFPHFDSAGFRYGLGVCPFVKVGSSVVFDPDKFTRPNYTTLQSRAYHDGARISNNSWGANTAGDYDVDAQSYDALVRDAQPSGSTYPATGNQQMVILFSAGNAGPGAQTVGAPGTAKNVITVGAAENVRSLSTANGGYDSAGDSGCQNDSDAAADSANDMTDFSSRGPCSDGRMKPDLVAPGTHVTGGVAQNSPPPSPAGTGSAISCYDSSGVCALPGSGSPGDPDNFFPLGQQFYTVSSGTSHSAPAVAGACALVRQFFINNRLTPPSPAMTKALLMNSARYLTGVYANDALWSSSQGMGEVNLGTAFDGVPRFLRDQLSADKFTATGQTRTFTGVVMDPTKPLRLTLAWTDAPGNTFGNAFNNDLDLTVTVGGNTYKGNVFSGAYSTTGGTADGKNNVESVFLPAGVSGNFTVTVTAANINSDGVPNEAPSLDQDFALVIYNAAQPTDLAISTSVLPTAVNRGTTVTFTLSVTNLGPATASSVTVTDTLPAGLSFVSATSSQGTNANNAGVVTCALGSMTNTTSATVTVQAIAAVAGSWTNTATVSSSTVDPANSNNTASAAVFVNSPPTISSTADVATDENTPVGPVAFTVWDVETPPTALTLSAASSNTNLVALADIVFDGSGSNRTVTITPATNRFGTTTITLTVSDGLASASDSFVLTVNPVNHPPVLAPIADQMVHALMTVAVTNSATDPDLPAQTLSFSLETNVPAGAVIDPTNGVFVWTPSDVELGTNAVTVRVTDNGSPPLSDAKTFSVTVFERPVLQASLTSSNEVTLVWTAIPDRVYRVQFKSDLSDATWQDMTPDVTATEFTASKVDALDVAAQRFYRVLVVR